VANPETSFFKKIIRIHIILWSNINIASSSCKVNIEPYGNAVAIHLHSIAIYDCVYRIHGTIVAQTSA